MASDDPFCHIRENVLIFITNGIVQQDWGNGTWGSTDQKPQFQEYARTLECFFFQCIRLVLTKSTVSHLVLQNPGLHAQLKKQKFDDVWDEFIEKWKDVEMVVFYYRLVRWLREFNVPAVGDLINQLDEKNRKLEQERDRNSSRSAHCDEYAQEEQNDRRGVTEAIRAWKKEAEDFGALNMLISAKKAAIEDREQEFERRQRLLEDKFALLKDESERLHRSTEDGQRKRGESRRRYRERGNAYDPGHRPPKDTLDSAHELARRAEYDFGPGANVLNSQIRKLAAGGAVPGDSRRSHEVRSVNLAGLQKLEDFTRKEYCSFERKCVRHQQMYYQLCCDGTNPKLPAHYVLDSRTTTRVLGDRLRDPPRYINLRVTQCETCGADGRNEYGLEPNEVFVTLFGELVSFDD